MGQPDFGKQRQLAGLARRYGGCDGPDCGHQWDGDIRGYVQPHPGVLTGGRLQGIFDWTAPPCILDHPSCWCCFCLRPSAIHQQAISGVPEKEEVRIKKSNLAKTISNNISNNTNKIVM